VLAALAADVDNAAAAVGGGEDVAALKAALAGVVAV
jgi:hypothetical protein